MKASDLLIKCLEAEGVRYVFGVPGEENEDVLFSLSKSKKIKFISTRHEQGAAFMADVWGRLTGTAGVCLSTLGPGATNLITGLADAHLDKAPIVALTGQGGLERMHKESHQMIDVVQMFQPIVKWNASITEAGIIPEVVRKAFKLAQMEKPGATHLELPEDVARTTTSGTPIEPRKLRRAAPDHKAMDQAMELLREAKHPIILAGNGSIRKLASTQLRIFADSTNIPVVSTFMGKGAVDDRDPHSLHTIGLQGQDFPKCALDYADLILTIGYDIAEYDPARWNGTGTPIIHIDFQAAEVYEHYQPQVEIVADISATLWELNQRLKKARLSHDPAWYAPVRAAMEKDLAGYELGPKDSITVPGALAMLRRVMADDDIIISDVGAHKLWIGRNFPVYHAGTCIISNSFASMGIAVPGGLAAKLAHPDKQVVAVTGDGGFLMNSQEIETATRAGVPYTILLLNDNNYGLITWKQEQSAHKHFGTELTNPDFEAYAKSFGIEAYHPKSPKELADCLAKCVASNKVSLVTVDVDSSENQKLSRKLGSNLCANFSLPKK